MVRDTSVQKGFQAAVGSEAYKAQQEQAKRAKKSKFTPASQHSRGNPIHRELKFHERKLLKKHDFMQYEQDNWHEPFCITKYHLEDREDYRRYLRLVGLIRQLLTQLRYLPADSKIRIEITQQLLEKLYQMGLINEKLGLAEVDKVGVEAFCKRRLPTILRDLKMSPNCKLAAETVHHGHVRIGTTQIRDPAFLVPRGQEDFVTWMPGSKIRQHVDTFNAKRDDFSYAAKLPQDPTETTTAASPKSETAGPSSSSNAVNYNSPLEILRRTRGQSVSIELTNGETVNGTVMRSDKAMNVVLKTVIRSSADGQKFWRSREALIRGASVRNIRMEDRALRAAPSAAALRRKKAASKAGQKSGGPKKTATASSGGGVGTHNSNASTGKRPNPRPTT